MIRPALIIGLDGATWDVIDPLLRRGLLPEIGGIIRRGVRAPLRSTVPPVTAAAWPSIITGMNPGQHGMFRFRMLDHESYEERTTFVSSEALVGRTIFDYVGSNGGQVLAAGVPMTYPPWAIQGKMVSGFPTPQRGVFWTQPPEWSDELAQNIQVPSREGGETWDVRTAEQFARFGEQFFAQGAAYLSSLLAREPFQLAMVVAMETDTVQHRFFHLRQDGPGPDDPIDVVYGLVDRFIGALLRAIDDKWLVVLVSDHGGGPRGQNIFYISEWLRQQGLLMQRQRPREGLARTVMPALRRVARMPGAQHLWRLLGGRTQRWVRRVQASAVRVDWSRTRAYHVRLFPPVAGINVNLRGREPFGVVEPGAEYEELRAQLLKGLTGLMQPENGEPLVLHVWKREELYSGPFLESAPDIVFQTHANCEVHDGLGRMWGRMSDVLGRQITGGHTMDGILAMAGRGVYREGVAVRDASVVDVAPTLLHGMGLPIPANMDGRLLDEVFEPQFLAANPVRHGPPLQSGAAALRAYSAEEEAGIATALRGLGYLD